MVINVMFKLFNKDQDQYFPNNFSTKNIFKNHSVTSNIEMTRNLVFEVCNTRFTNNISQNVSKGK